MAFKRMNLEGGAGSNFIFRRGNNFGDRLVALGQQHFVAGLNPLNQLGKPAGEFIDFRSRCNDLKLNPSHDLVQSHFRVF